MLLKAFLHDSSHSNGAYFFIRWLKRRLFLALISVSYEKEWHFGLLLFCQDSQIPNPSPVNMMNLAIFTWLDLSEDRRLGLCANFQSLKNRGLQNFAVSHYVEHRSAPLLGGRLQFVKHRRLWFVLNILPITFNSLLCCNVLNKGLLIFTSPWDSNRLRWYIIETYLQNHQDTPLLLYPLLCLIDIIRLSFNDTPQRNWFIEVITRLLHQLIRI